MMKTIPILPAILACVLAACAPAQSGRTPAESTGDASSSVSAADDSFAPNPPPGMKLVWSDEFDADGRPDPANWTYETGYVRNHEAQWYRPESAEVRDGCLVITAEHHEQPLPNPNPFARMFGGNGGPIEYTSACLITKGLHAFQYGRIEARIKAPLMEGAWPAFWTLGVSENWPSCGEIDIFEYYQDIVLANFCWSSAKGQWTAEWSSVKTRIEQYKRNDPEWADKFHVYAMDWNEHRITLSVDGVPVNDSSIDDVRNARFRSVENPFRQPHYLLVNLALGGDSGGDVTKVPFPVRMYVDYVRVYQKSE
jgi:VCBS repeat-containing protein